jgi:hypothetical protein
MDQSLNHIPCQILSLFPPHKSPSFNSIMLTINRTADHLPEGDGFRWTEPASQCHETMRKERFFPFATSSIPRSFSRRLLLVTTFLAADDLPGGDGFRYWAESAGQCHETKTMCSFRDFFYRGVFQGGLLLLSLSSTRPPPSPPPSSFSSLSLDGAEKLSR